MKRYLIWDFDGTLAERNGAWSGALAEVWNTSGLGNQLEPACFRSYLQRDRAAPLTPAGAVTITAAYAVGQPITIEMTGDASVNGITIDSSFSGNIDLSRSFTWGGITQVEASDGTIITDFTALHHRLHRPG